MSLFRVFVDFSGTRGIIYVKSSYTIERVRELIVTAYEDESVRNLTLINCKGMHLLELKTIFDHGIKADDTIFVLLSGKPNPFRVRVLAKTQHGTTHLPLEANEFVTIEHVKQLIYEQLEKNETLSELSLTFEGRQLEDEKTLTDYDIRSGDAVTFIYKFASGKTMVPISVRTMEAKMLRVYVNTSYTVEHLKALINCKRGFLCESPLFLVFGGRELEHGRKLSDYRIMKDSTVHIVLRLRGGGYSIRQFLFTNVGTMPFQIRLPSPTDPTYRHFSNGVSSEGVCVNPTCVVYGEKFVCQHGYGVYRVNEHPTRCPECQGTSPRVESFGFSRANVIVRTMPLGLKGQQAEVRSDLSETKGNYACLPYFLLHSYEDTNKNYEFIEVFSCTPECSITLSEKLCSLCSRTLQVSCACNHGLPDIGPLTL